MSKQFHYPGVGIPIRARAFLGNNTGPISWAAFNGPICNISLDPNDMEHGLAKIGEHIWLI